MSDSNTPQPAGRTWGTIAAVVIVAVIVGVVTWAVRGQNNAGGATAAPTVTETVTASPTSSPEMTATTGCPAVGGGVPAGAGVATVVDVDGDERLDQAWITGGAGRTIGITTASGATFSAPIDSASPLPASAIVQIVQPDKLPIVLVDVEREALVYAVQDCQLKPVLNEQNEQYSFDRGLGDEGTGVGCNEEFGSLRLAGLDVVADGALYDVQRTFIAIDPTTLKASNGTRETVVTGVGADDPAVVTGREVTCGDLVAGKDGPVEPES